jgi:D-beta-D-heptose 7-phosphate kinase/D-beta-D-heptose 1-phosphate adenosyltransferase
MNKIISIKEAKTIAKDFKKQNKKIIITGGCFDILHVGHMKLFNESKKQGDFLFVLLENDKTVKKLKGMGRPIYPQLERAEVLANLSSIDYIVMLNEMKNNEDYDNLITDLMPSVITTTENDPQAIHNERQAKKIGAKVLYVTKRINNKSTSLIAKIISDNFDK